MRNLDTVIRNILKIVPADEKQLIGALRDNLSSVEFSSPEMLSFWWNEVADTLMEEIGEPKLGWQLKVANEFNGKE